MNSYKADYGRGQESAPSQTFRAKLVFENLLIKGNYSDLYLEMNI